jgi:hypothetical protein
MKKKILKYIIPILCVIVVGVAFYMIFDIKNKVDESLYNTDDISNVTNDDIVEEDISNDIINEVNEVNEIDEVDENTISNETNKVVENKVDTKADREAVEEKTDEGSTTKKQQAIELVKKEWGEDSSVSYRCETVNSKGEYVVAVIMKSSGSVKAYFNVNLETKSVQIDY